VSGSDAKASSELAATAEAFAEVANVQFFKNPGVSAADKMQLAEAVLSGKVSEPVLNLVKVVLENGKAGELSEIAASYAKLSAEMGGATVARVESSAKLDAKTLQSIAAALQKMTGREVQVEPVINKDLLGGLKVLLGDEVIDLSLASRLVRLQQALV
jgi:F-type H+-transporting ATPase subunit delta